MFVTRYLLSSLQKNPQAQEIVKLKIGAQVILLSNLNVGGGLCNGTRGVITWFADMRKVPAFLIKTVSLRHAY